MTIFKDLIAKFIDYDNKISELEARNVQDAIDEIDKSINNLESNVFVYTLFEDISGLTSGNVTMFSNINIYTDKWDGTYNAQCFELDINGRPDLSKPLRTSLFLKINANINSSGSFTLTGTPTATSYCLIWRVICLAEFAHTIPQNMVISQLTEQLWIDNGTDFVSLNDRNINLQTSGLKDTYTTTAIKLGDNLNTSFMTTNKTIVGSVNELKLSSDILLNIPQTTKDPTGFTTPESVIITGNNDRTVTLTGTFEAYYRGFLNTTIVSGWTSPQHGTDTTKVYFLLYNGTSIIWLDLSLISAIDYYSNLLIAVAFYNSNDNVWVYQRECHGLNYPWSVHRDQHLTKGTYRASGGTLADYVLNSTIEADRRPSINSALIYDEDLPTTQSILPKGTYTQFYLTSTGIHNFITGQSDIIPLSSSNPYYNQFTGGVWQQTLLPTGNYMAIWVVDIPMANDINSQKISRLFIQGQITSNNIETIRSLTANNVNLGTLSSLTPELIFTSKIIIRYIGGNWQIIEIENLTGTRVSQSISGTQGLYLSSVATDSTLTGLGTFSSQLGLNLNNENTWNNNINLVSGYKYKINGVNLSYSDVGAEQAFTKNTAFNKNFGTTSGTVAEGNHLHSGVYELANSNIQSHISSTSNPHNVTKTQIGLGNVENTALSTWAGTTNFTTAGNLTSSSLNVNGNTYLNLINGKTGVGTNSPYAKLQIDNESAYSSLESDVNGLMVKGTDQALYMGADTPNRVSYIQSVDFGTAVSNLALNARGGNVGIGTIVPIARLEVAGNIRVKNGIFGGGSWPDEANPFIIAKPDGTGTGIVAGSAYIKFYDVNSSGGEYGGTNLEIWTHTYGGGTNKNFEFTAARNFNVVFGKVREYGNDLVPRGIISMWSGLVSAIPAGWALCDGGTYTAPNGNIITTPNLKGKFVVGYDVNDTDFDTIGETGGSKTHTHTGHINTNSSYNGVSGGAGGFVVNETPTSPTYIDYTSNVPPYYVLAYIMKL